jgi:protein TonB
MVRMQLRVIGAGFGRPGSPGKALDVLGVLALAVALVLAGCLRPPAENRPTPPPIQPVPVPVSPRTVPLSQLDTQPQPIDVAIPSSEYPREALVANAQAPVLLRILIDETGRVRDAQVLRDPHHGLGEAAARSAIAHFRFSPGRLHGQPVATWWPFSVVYELDR